MFPDVSKSAAVRLSHTQATLISGSVLVPTAFCHSMRALEVDGCSRAIGGVLLSIAILGWRVGWGGFTALVGWRALRQRQSWTAVLLALVPRG